MSILECRFVWSAAALLLVVGGTAASPPLKQPAADVTVTVVVTKDDLAVDEPDLTGVPLFRVLPGDVYPVLEQHDGWLRLGGIAGADEAWLLDEETQSALSNERPSVRLGPKRATTFTASKPLRWWEDSRRLVSDDELRERSQVRDFRLMLGAKLLEEARRDPSQLPDGESIESIEAELRRLEAQAERTEARLAGSGRSHDAPSPEAGIVLPSSAVTSAEPAYPFNAVLPARTGLASTPEGLWSVQGQRLGLLNLQWRSQRWSLALPEDVTIVDACSSGSMAFLLPLEWTQGEPIACFDAKARRLVDPVPAPDVGARGRHAKAIAAIEDRLHVVVKHVGRTAELWTVDAETGALHARREITGSSRSLWLVSSMTPHAGHLLATVTLDADERPGVPSLVRIDPAEARVVQELSLDHFATALVEHEGQLLVESAELESGTWDTTSRGLRELTLVEP
ncbi:MAG: hypothetical protein AAF533_18475 [Acidobacteriota bacterium]